MGVERCIRWTYSLRDSPDTMMNHTKFADELLGDFLQHVRTLGGDVEPVKVLRSNTYRIGNSHVLARVAADTGKYFSISSINPVRAAQVAQELDTVAYSCVAMSVPP